MPYDIDPEILRAILQGGAQSGQLDPEIEQMKQRAEMLRGTAPDMNLSGYGPMRVAPGWLKTIAGGLNGFMQNRVQQQQMQMQKQQAGIRADQNQRILDALMRMSGGQGSPQAPQQQPDAYAPFRIGMGA